MNQHVCIVRPTRRLDGHRFLPYCLSAPWGQEIEQVFPASQARLPPRGSVSGGGLGSDSSPLPPLPEQQRIAAYLDASCAAIDAAVAAKRRQLETLDGLVEEI